MPSVPEVCDRNSLIGRIEVDRQIQVQHPGDTKRHITVARKVEIDLQGIAQHHEDRTEGIQLRNIGIAYRNNLGKGIGDQYLFRKTKGKGIQSLSKVGKQYLFTFRILKLGNQLTVVNDRTRRNAWEKGNISQIIRKTISRTIFPVAVYSIGDLLEGIKTDTKRQKKLHRRKISVEGQIYIFQKEAGIFINKKQANVPYEQDDQIYPAFRCPSCLLHETDKGIIDHNTDKQDQQGRNAVVAIKAQGHGGQEIYGRPGMTS